MNRIVTRTGGAEQAANGSTTQEDGHTDKVEKVENGLSAQTIEASTAGYINRNRMLLAIFAGVGIRKLRWIDVITLIVACLSTNPQYYFPGTQ